jgi:hypothetical protein
MALVVGVSRQPSLLMLGWPLSLSRLESNASMRYRSAGSAIVQWLPRLIVFARLHCLGGQ